MARGRERMGAMAATAAATVAATAAAATERIQWSEHSGTNTHGENLFEQKDPSISSYNVVKALGAKAVNGTDPTQTGD
jgi:hypothetical protein